MAHSKIMVVVICTPGSKRYVPIKSILANDKRFDLKFITASMTFKFSDVTRQLIHYNDYAFKCYEGRELKAPEIGCAHSHNMARRIIYKNRQGGIILEDDARILDVENVYRIVTDFLNDNLKSKCILNLTPFRNLVSHDNALPKLIHILRPPDLAVAYALTSSAAEELIKANSPVSWVSDWPISKNKHYVTSHLLVRHGDLHSKSIILGDSQEFRNRMSLKHKIDLFLFITYFQNRKILDLREYLIKVFIHRFFWHAEKFRLLILGLRPLN